MKGEAITAAEFAQWANDPVTCYVRNKLIEQRNEYANLDETLAEQAVYSKDADLQQLGLDSALRMATIRGIELFTDTDSMFLEWFPETKEAVDEEL